MDSSIDLVAQRILITGATGFIGSHLCGFLRGSANDLHAISRKPQTGGAALKWWRGDLADFTTTRNLLGAIKPDVIFHLTTHGHGAPDLEHVLPSLHNDLLATVNLLTAAAEIKVRRIVITRSLEEPESNDPELVPSTPYAAAKWGCGAYARMFHRLYQTPVALVRIFMTYGPGQPIQKLIPYVICSLLKREPPKVSSGQRLIDWIYIDDVVRGLVAAAQASDIEGCTVDLGSGTLVSIRQIVERLVALTGTDLQPLFGAVPPRPIEPVRAADTGKTHERLGWKPAMSLDSGLELTLNWYRAQLQNEGFDLPPRMTARAQTASQPYGRLQSQSRN